MKLSPITTKQQDILKLLYRYRFLNRVQIQALMGHKNKRRIAEWLSDLRDSQYVEWIYDGYNFIEKTKPAVYYLGLNGIRYLRTLEEFPSEGLRKRYRESSRQPDFIARCLLIADCGLNLDERSRSVTGLDYSFGIQADYADPDHDYHHLGELGPDLCYTRTQQSSEGATTTTHLVVIFDPTLPRYRVRHRLKTYVAYVSDGDWEAQTGDDEPPIVMFICPTVAELAYAKRATHKLLEHIWDDETPEDIHLRFATVAKVRSEGVTGIIWEEV